MPRGVSFDEDTHTYNVDGEIYETVTEVTSQLLPVQFFTEEARQRGTDVHAQVDAINQAIMNHRLHQTNVSQYANAYEAFLDDMKFKPTHSEFVVFNRTHKYAGTLDIAGHIGRDPCLIDVKTGEEHPVYALQTAALAAAFSQRRDNFEIKRRFTLVLQPTGRYRLFEHKGRSDLTVFLAQLNVYRWKVNNNLINWRTKN